MTVRAKRVSRLASKCLVLLLGLLIVFSDNGVAQAASNEGPIHVDNDGTQLIAPNSSLGNSFPSAGRYWDYVVSYDDYTDVTSSDVLVYSPVQRPTITIIGSDLCVNNNQNMRAGDVPYSPAMPSGRRANDYRLYTFDPTPGATYGNGISVAYDTGVWNYGTAATCRASTVTLTPVGYSPRDPGTNMYIYRINALANMVSGGKFANSFHVVGPAGSIITQSSDSGFSGFGMQASYPFPDAPTPNDPTPPDPHRVYSDLFIPFGPDCTLTTPTATKSVIITDADNDNQYSVQPQPFRIAVQAFTQSTGVYRGYVPLTWRDVGAGWATDVSGGARTVWEPHGSNQTGVLFDFTVQQGVVYRLVIARVYYNNTLEFRLPYDGAHFYIPCRQPTTVRPVVTMSPKPAAENGVALTGTAAIQNVGNNPVASVVNYTRRIWSDTNRNSAYDPGERVFGGTPQSGTVTVPPGSGSFPLATWSEIADSGIHGGRVCIILGISASPPVTVQPANGLAVDCVDIGKKPKLQVQNGDVMVGGTFRNAAGVCPAQGAPSSTNLALRGSQSVIGGVTYSSFADYGANSLGQITLFGANGTNPATPISNNLSFGNESPLGYFYSNPGTGAPTQGRCLSDPFAAFSSKGAFSTQPSLPAGINVVGTGANINYTGGGELRIGSSGPLPAGFRRTIYAPNADQVTIVSNLTYGEGPYNSADQIPRLVVITGGRIVVEPGVTRIDGIFGSRNAFYTCFQAPRLNNCNQQLTVNGMVITSNILRPYRTFGAQSPNHADKAEIFRLHPSALLNQVPGPGDTVTVRTINQREVPPRF